MIDAPAKSPVADLPYLIRLLDDDSEPVRTAVAERLREVSNLLGGDFDREIARQQIILTPAQARALRAFNSGRRRKEFAAAWPRWRSANNEFDQIENALGMLSDYLRGRRPGDGAAMRSALDALGEAYLDAGSEPTVESLAAFLFGEGGRMRGNTLDYYAPENSDLAWVIDGGRGNPISLACVFMLVGRRVGLRIHGCNYPGHFLARVELRGEVHLVDCFNGGTLTSARELYRRYPMATEEVKALIDQRAPALEIIARTLHNLEVAYTKREEPDERRLAQDLIRLTLRP